MKTKNIVIIAAISIVVICLAIFFIPKNSNPSEDLPSGDLPGEVIGPNPDNIPEDKLPICNFNGAAFVEEPCYSPPDSLYI